MVRKHGRAALVSAMIIPFAAAALGLVRGARQAMRPWPYFAGFAVGNYIGLWRGLIDRRVPAPGPARRLLVGGTVAWLLALPALLGLTAAALVWLLLKAGHAAYQGHLLLVTLAILVVAIPLEVGKGAGTGRFPAIARALAPFAASAMVLALAAQRRATRQRGRAMKHASPGTDSTNTRGKHSAPAQVTTGGSIHASQF